MKLLTTPIILLLLLFQLPNRSYGQWNYDISYKAIEKVSVEPYASVQEIPDQDPKLCLGLAISGGGSRAQYFGTGVLLELSELTNLNKKTFLTEVDYFSSASGGGFAIGYYMMVRKIGLLKAQSYFDYWKTEIPYDKNGLQSFVYMPASKWTSLKLNSYEKHKRYNKSYPKIIDYDLLKANSYRSFINITVPQLLLSDFFVQQCDSCKATLPMFVPNASIYPNCERLPIMPHILSDLKINRSIIPSYPFKDNTGYSFPLAFALAASSAVPGILPIQKLGASDNNMAIRAMDGGVVDNLGIKTLFELLLSDKSDKKKKRMLIIDCSGVGNESRYSDSNDQIGLFSLLKESSFFTVSSKNIVAKETVDLLETANLIPLENDLILGMQDIREGIKKDITPEEEKKINIYKNRWKVQEEFKNTIFEEMYRELATTFGKKTGKNDPKLRLGRNITSIELANASKSQKFLIYEMASHVITKVKIDEWEQEILILAGRLLVSDNREAIRNLLN